MIPIFLFLIGFVIIFDTSFKKTEGHPDKKWLIHSLKIHFSEKCSRDNFYGHVRSREGTWAIKNQVPIILMELKKQDPEVNDASSTTFSFFIFLQLYFFTPLVAPSSSSLLPPCSSFVQHCLNHLESIKGHFSSSLTKA